jgi:putative sterol carrier protein
VTRPSDLLARGFARFVARSSDERLRGFVSGRRRRLVLNAIFRQMPKRLNREQAKDVEAVTDWKIRGAPGGGVDHYQVVIRDGKCRSTRRPTESPRATLELDANDFLRLAAGVAQGPELFMAGKLRVEGDLMFTTRLPSLFRVPAPR